MDRRAWWPTVHEVAKNQMRLKWCMQAWTHTHTHTHTYRDLQHLIKRICWKVVITIFENIELSLFSSLLYTSSPCCLHGSLISQFSSVQFSHPVVSDSLQPHESQHARPPCPSPTPRVYSNSCPLSQWCHPAILSSVAPFSCPQTLPASGSVPMSQLFAWGGQSTEFQLQHQSFQWTPRTDLL